MALLDIFFHVINWAKQTLANSIYWHTTFFRRFARCERLQNICLSKFISICSIRVDSPVEVGRFTSKPEQFLKAGNAVSWKTSESQIIHIYYTDAGVSREKQFEDITGREDVELL